MHSVFLMKTPQRGQFTKKKMEVEVVYQMRPLPVPSPADISSEPHRRFGVLSSRLPGFHPVDVYVQPGTLTEDKNVTLRLLELEPPTPILLTLNVVGTCHRLCHAAGDSEVAASRLSLDLNFTLQSHVVLSLFDIYFL